MEKQSSLEGAKSGAILASKADGVPGQISVTPKAFRRTLAPLTSVWAAIGRAG